MNKVILSGRIAKDWEIRYTTSNTAVVTFSLAVRKIKSEQKNDADFFQIVTYGKTAELVNQYCQKGSTINVTGHLSTRNYDDKDGKKVYVTEVIADEVEFVSSPKKEETKAEKQQYEPITDADLPF